MSKPDKKSYIKPDFRPKYIIHGDTPKNPLNSDNDTRSPSYQKPNQGISNSTSSSSSQGVSDSTGSDSSQDDEQQDSERNQSLGDLNNQESNPKNNDNNDTVDEQERNGSKNWNNRSNITSGGWSDKTSSTNTGSTKSKIRFSFLKKKGPLTAIILTIAGGAVGIVGLSAPTLLLVQFKEVMVEAFDAQYPSMHARTKKILIKKTTKGMGCASPVSILCKYETMSKKQVANFEKAGIKVNYKNNSTLLGRLKPTSFVFEGKTIKAADFAKEMKNTKFASAVRYGYNPRFAGFADYIWKNKVEPKLGISKAAADLGDANATDAERLEKVRAATNETPTVDPATFEEATINDKDENGDPKYASLAEVDAINAERRAAAEAANELADAAAKAGGKGIKVAPSILKGITGIGNALKITGMMDTACTVYGTIRAVGFAAKTVRALQLARYAMIFLNVADQIKAGTATQENVAYLGKILTTEVAASAATVKDKYGTEGPATSSFGYQFAAYGKGGKMSSTTSQFLAGGGLAGSLIKVTDMIDDTLGGHPKSKCKFLKNPIVSVASLIVGLALFLVPGVNIGNGWRVAISVAAGVTFEVAMAYLPALLQDIIAGNLIDKDTVGEAAGEAITSGASGIMSTSAQAGGNAPLTPAEAVAYHNFTNDVIAQDAELDRLAYSPLDASNKNTFMGKIVAQLIPYASNMSSLSGALSSIASMTTGSFASLAAQTANAASIDDYTMCQDYDYKDLKGDGTNVRIATDPYCNITYGIPPSALNADPVIVAEDLINAGQIDPETGEPTGDEYKKFITNCIDRIRPLGDSGADFQLSDGSECLFGENVEGTSYNNKNFYIHYIDQRVQTGLDDEEETTDTTTPTDGTPTGNAQQLAQEILDNNKIDLSYTGSAGIPVKKDVQDAAAGKVGSAGAMTSTAILQLIASLGRDHTVMVSAIQSGGKGHSTGSTHYSGNAVDFAMLDGSAVTGRNPGSITIIEKAESLWPTGSQFGQLGCPGQTAPVPSGWSTFSDSCTHVHLNVPAGTP